jgi:hypothetical protein
MEGDFSHYLRCPECDSTDLHLAEDVPTLRRQAGVDTDGTAWFYGKYEVWDKYEGDDYLKCFGCMTELPLPARYDFAD